MIREVDRRRKGARSKPSFEPRRLVPRILTRSDSGDDRDEKASRSGTGGIPRANDQKTAIDPDRETIAGAVDRQAWIASPERARHLRATKQYLIVSVAAAILFGLAAFLFDWRQKLLSCPGSYSPAECESDALYEALLQGLAYVGFVLLFLMTLGLYSLYFLRVALRRRARDRLALELAREQLQATEKAVYPQVNLVQGHADPEGAESSSELKLSLLWNATHERLNLYHQIATEQAKSSFIRAQAAMMAGFLIVAASLVLAVTSDSSTGTVVIGVLGAGGGALSAYISQTFLRSQETAADHLRAYFLQPLEFSRYLVAERLLNTLGDEQKANGILLIVQGIANFPVGSDEDRASRKT